MLNQIEVSLNQKRKYKKSQQIVVSTNPKIQQIEMIKWINTFNLPHCHDVQTILDCRNGIAIAQILSTNIDNLPNRFLSQITINNCQMEICLKNLAQILNQIKKIDSGFIKYKPIELYNNQKTLFQFLKDLKILIQYKQVRKNKQNYIQNIPNDINYNVGIQQLSQIANISNVYSNIKQKDKKSYDIYNAATVNFNQQNYCAHSQPKKDQFLVNDQQKNQNMLENQDFSVNQFYNLKHWLLSKCLSLEGSPHQIIAKLINKIATDRLNPNPIIKKSHIEMGQLTVWRKISQYLIGIQRMQKQNIIKLIKQLQQQNIVRENIFWKVINDIKQMFQGKINKKYTSNRSQSKISISKSKNNKDIKIIKNPSIKSLKKQQSQKIINKIPTQLIVSTQKWLEQLGYTHSLMISKQKYRQSSNILNNPLFNGNIVGSLLMRLQIGRPVIIREPLNQKQVEKNFQQILKVCVGRGYGSVRDFFRYKGNYDNYIRIIAQIRVQYNENKRILKQSQYKSAQTKSSDYEFPHKDIIQWLENHFHLEFNQPIKQIIKPKQLSAICSHLLDINLYRETTKKIQIQNADKILQEMRKMGLSYYYGVKGQDLINDESVYLRWKIINDLYSVFGKSQFE